MCDDVGIQTDIGHEGKCSCQLMIKKKQQKTKSKTKPSKPPVCSLVLDCLLSQNEVN